MSEERNDLESLAIALANAKDVEAQAKEARIKAEEELANAIGGKDIGSTSVKCGRLGVTIKRGYNYKLDQPKAFADKFPDFAKVTEKVEVNASAYEKLRECNPDLFAHVSSFVTITPKKVSVELKL